MNVSNGIENLSQILPSATLEPTAGTVKAQEGLSEVSNSGGLSGQTNSTDRASTDKAELSTVGTQAAQSVALDNADVRLDKVASIQAALQAGTYRVPASAVAQKLIASLIAPEK